MLLKITQALSVLIISVPAAWAQGQPYTSAFSQPHYAEPPLFAGSLGGHEGFQISGQTCGESGLGTYGNGGWNPNTPVYQMAPSQMVLSQTNPYQTLPQQMVAPSACAECQPYQQGPMCPPNVCTSCFASPCDESGRRFAVDFNSIFLFRHRPQSQLLFLTPGSATEQINAAGFQPGVAPGFEAAVLWYDQSTFSDIEVRATWLDEWSDRTDRLFTGPIVQMELNPAMGTSGPRNAAATYASQFGSIEINSRYRTGQGSRGLTLLMGFRILRLNEVLNAAFVDPGGILPDELIRTTTQNDLYGLQVGADSILLHRPRWCAKVNGRIGLYGNAADQNTQLTTNATLPVTFTANGKQGDLAFHAELGLSGKFRLSPWANLTAGYRALYIDGLALAPEQLAASSFLTNSGFHGNSAILLHAATVGLEFAY